MPYYMLQAAYTPEAWAAMAGSKVAGSRSVSTTSS